jgi:hypothetical protein
MLREAVSAQSAFCHGDAFEPVKETRNGRRRRGLGRAHVSGRGWIGMGVSESVVSVAAGRGFSWRFSFPGFKSARRGVRDGVFRGHTARLCTIMMMH